MALDTEAIEKQLQEERAQLLSRPIAPPEPVQGDEADMAALQQAKEQSQWLANDQSQRLAQIDRVLARIALGNYGICDNCGKPIARERMQAIPHATLCIECQSKLEKKRK